MSLALKPTHATVKAYYETLHQYGQLHIDHEGAVRSAFHDLLAKSGRKAKPPLTLVPEYRIERARGSSVIVDGALVDLYHLPHGYWEAKDEKDDLAKEVQLKLDKGYPRESIIFQAPERAEAGFAPEFCQSRTANSIASRQSTEPSRRCHAPRILCSLALLALLASAAV
jgi:hypothetical protein